MSDSYQKVQSPTQEELDDVARVDRVEVIEEAKSDEVRGWFVYDWSNGPFFYSALNFIPLMITAQLRDLGKIQFCDTFHNGNCMNNEWAEDYENDGVCSKPKFDNATMCLANEGTWEADLNHEAATVHWWGVPIGYASFTQYCLAFSVFMQLLVFVSLGSFADYGGNRKKMFILVNSLGVSACALIALNSGVTTFWWSGILYITAIVCMSFSVVFYNAYLPLLAGARKKTLDAQRNGSTSEEVQLIAKEMTHEMSIKGLAAGFSGQLLFLMANVAILIMVTKDRYLNSRISILAAAVWVLIFSSYTFTKLKKRPGPPLPEGQSYFNHSVQAAKRTTKSLRKLRQLGLFLFAYFIFSDGTSTIATSAPIFAQEELRMSVSEIGISLVLVSIAAVIGCYGYQQLHNRFNVAPKTILIINLVQMGLIPVYSMVAMTTKYEFYGAILVFGINTGSRQAFTRSIFANFVPHGREAEYFSFYEIADKGTAWLGPLMIGVINQATDSYRSAFSAVLVFFVIGIFILCFVDTNKAQEQKRAFDEEANPRLSIVDVEGNKLEKL